MIIKEGRRRQFARHQQHAVELGVHHVATADQAHEVRLPASMLDVSKLHLDTYMELDHLHVWEASVHAGMGR